ncbi:ATP-binding protein [Tenacibaculum soleae]|uniref:ATP-binding protein n=1 Tax=Tenacibaculum soleae TaxID=447689 RepID=UPI002301349D|nr:ATP-binding protein [Tenacibaculum soleae]
MSQMLAEISRIVNEDISSRVNQYDVLYEAITNSIHSNSTDIKCFLNTNENLIKEGDDELGNIKLDTIRIVDNGDGFDSDNYGSFSTYRTKFKKELGCKGVGRFVFLKVYKNAIYTSKLSSLKESRRIKFDFKFDTDNLSIENSDVKENETEVLFQSLTEQYLNWDKKLDRRIKLDIYKIKNKVLMNLIPTLFFYKEKKNRDITIQFIDLHKNISVKITSNDIPEFTIKEFKVSGNDGVSYKFKLNYGIQESSQGKLNAYYCANSRTVCEFENKDLKINIPSKYSGFMLLESKYLDLKANNERNDFDIFPVKTDFVSPISWEMINSELKIIISNIIKESIPDTEKINIEKLKEIQDERPYLVNYIDSGDIEMAGFLNKKQIIDKAKKRFDIVKEKVLTSSGKLEYSDEELKEAITLAQNELVSYINDRVIVIERLKTLVEKSERVESVIHNLFMEKYTTDDYYSVGKNNLWLLDDRFTTYSYAASDKRIIDVLKDINETTDDVDILNDKPDLSLFFSHNPNNSDRLKSVLVEIKPFDFSTKSDRKKFAGIQQLFDYVKAFKEKEKIKEVYGYLITDIDENLSERLKDDGYKPLFSVDSPIYHRHYERKGISIYVVSAKTLVYDAEARNKVFLDIIKKNKRITKLVS